MVRRIILVTLALACTAGALAYGLESPAEYDAAAATYFYPRRPHRDLILAAGLTRSAALLLGAWLLTRTRPHHLRTGIS